jgi:hypothetical protein
MGPTTFSRSGSAAIAAGKNSVTVQNMPLTSSSLILATLQGPAIAGLLVQTVVVNVSGDSFEIVLSAKVPTGKAAKVAWFVLS